MMATSTFLRYKLYIIAVTNGFSFFKRNKDVAGALSVYTDPQDFCSQDRTIGKRQLPPNQLKTNALQLSGDDHKEPYKDSHS